MYVLLKLVLKHSFWFKVVMLNSNPAELLLMGELTVSSLCSRQMSTLQLELIISCHHDWK